MATNHVIKNINIFCYSDVTIKLKTIVTIALSIALNICYRIICLNSTYDLKSYCFNFAIRYKWPSASE